MAMKACFPIAGRSLSYKKKSCMNTKSDINTCQGVHRHCPDLLSESNSMPANKEHNVSQIHSYISSTPRSVSSSEDAQGS